MEWMINESQYLHHLVRSNRLEEGRFLIEGAGLQDEQLRKMGLCSVRGRTHKRNDDYLHIAYGIPFRGESFNLYAVYDGVSIGRQRIMQGAKASLKAASAINEFFRDFASLCNDPKELLHSAFDYANNSLEKQTNATTAVLAFINPESGVCFAGSVGDSQIVIIREGRVIPANRPHRHPLRRNIITRKLGPDSKGRIKEERGDISVFILLENDIVVLASDGIEDVTAEQMLESLEATDCLQGFTERLAQLGEPKGDDRTIIALRI